MILPSPSARERWRTASFSSTVWFWFFFFQVYVLGQNYHIKALCAHCVLLLSKDFDIVSLLWAWSIAYAFLPPFHLPAIHFIKKPSMFIRKKKAKKKKKLNFKGLQFICMNSWLSQPSLSAVRRVQWGEWSTVNHYCYSTDYTARPSICLPPSLTLPPPSQDARIILPPDICLYSSLGPPTPALYLSDPQIPSHMPSLMEKCSWLLALPACRKRHLPGEWKKEEKYAGGFGKKTVSSIVVRGDWGIQQASQQPFIHCARQPSSRTRTSLAKIDLHSLICPLLQQLSCCWEDGGGCSQTGWHGPMSNCSW